MAFANQDISAELGMYLGLKIVTIIFMISITFILS